MYNISQFNRRPYGAWELKTTYQRNMLLSIMIVTTTILSLVILAQLLGLHSKSVLPEIEITDDIVIIKEWQRAPKLKDDFPPVAGRNNRPSQREIKPMVIPVAVADSLIYESEEPEDIINQDVISDSIDHDNIEGGGGGPGEWNDSSGNGVSYDGDCYTCLDPDSFIPLEIYPEMISEETPVYPEIARQVGFEGSVWLQVLIDRNGQVVRAEIAKTSGLEMLDDAALKASWHNRFSPGIQSGRAVIVWVKYKVDFKMQE